MSRTIPPFAALRAFEATARLGKQSDAAEELRISTSAISHQIRALEAYLGVPLFERTPSGLNLTDQGRSYFDRVCDALDIIAAATAERVSSVDDTPLKLHMFQSLANLWFIPHLHHFTEGLPDQRVVVLTQPENVKLSGSDIDAAIIYSEEKPATPYADQLFEEVIVPVCSPSFLQAFGPLDTVEKVLSQRLIGSANDPGEWKQWAEGCGISHEPHPAHLSFDNRSNALQAAREGFGLAMDRRPFGELHKAQGLLLEPIPRPVTTGWSYYFVSSERSHGFRRVRKIREWLFALCSGFR